MAVAVASEADVGAAARVVGVLAGGGEVVADKAGEEGADSGETARTAEEDGRAAKTI